MYKKGVELRADGFDILVVEYDFFFMCTYIPLKRKDILV